METQRTSTSLSAALGGGSVSGAEWPLCPSGTAEDATGVNQSEGLPLLPAPSPVGSRDGTVSEASRWPPPRRGYSASSQDDVHLPPGRHAPQIRLPLPPLQLRREGRELLAPLLTEPVQEARSAVSWRGEG